MTEEQLNMQKNLRAFVNQCHQTGALDQKTSGYINYYQGLDVKVSFGFGQLSHIPWISFLGENQVTMHGIYVVLLYYRKLRKMALCYGISELNQPDIHWDFSGTPPQTIGEYLKEHGFTKQKKYNGSYIYKFFSIDDDSDFADVVEALDEIIPVYKQTLKRNGLKDNVDMPSSLKTEYTGPFANLTYSPGQVSITSQEPSFTMTNEKIKSAFIDATKQSNLIFEDSLISRFVTSLATKPFVILSGLSGSGKTQLATAFARWISVDYEKQVCVVPVGADWTNREFLLGYTNALEPQKYETTEVVRLMQRAQQDPDNPYLLILDEMNLSYVERYFADFLSAMESGEPISLWEKPTGSTDPTPNKINQLPQNLFIIGTINVDETTYMFSPKVLDRANVIEFRIMREDMKKFFAGFKPVNKGVLDANNNEEYGKLFVRIARDKIKADEEIMTNAVATLENFFDELKKVHAEFGYRTASEMFRFMTLYKQFDSTSGFDFIVDAAIVQKLLPKLHGSRKKIVDVLNKLWALCLKSSDENNGLEKIKEFKKEDCKYPLSAEKIFRMYNIAIDNGYTSFAEA